MCVKSITMISQLSGVTITTSWVVRHIELAIRKMNTPLREEFQLAQKNKILTSILPPIAIDML